MTHRFFQERQSEKKTEVTRSEASEKLPEVVRPEASEKNPEVTRLKF